MDTYFLTSVPYFVCKDIYDEWPSNVIACTDYQWSKDETKNMDYGAKN